MYIRSLLLCLALFFSGIRLYSQDLLDLFNDSTDVTNYTYATFKTTRIVNSQSVENPANGVLLFMISHHFGRINEGGYELFGLDKSTIRFGLEYGLGDRLAIGVGRSSFNKNFEGSLKFKILRQSTGKKKMPFTVCWYSDLNLNSLKWQYPERTNYFTSRLSYVHQLLIARKFSPGLSLQVSPTYIHNNLVATANDPNDIYAIGFGGRCKLSKRISLNAEYFYVLPGKNNISYNNSLSIGFDIETGGHVFQLHFTNSQPLYEKAFITETTGKWKDGDIHFGFNISRVFTVRQPKNK